MQELHRTESCWVFVAGSKTLSLIRLSVPPPQFGEGVIVSRRSPHTRFATGCTCSCGSSTSFRGFQGNGNDVGPGAVTSMIIPVFEEPSNMAATQRPSAVI